MCRGDVPTIPVTNIFLWGFKQVTSCKDSFIVEKDRRIKREADDGSCWFFNMDYRDIRNISRCKHYSPHKTQSQHLYRDYRTVCSLKSFLCIIEKIEEGKLVV